MSDTAPRHDSPKPATSAATRPRGVAIPLFFVCLPAIVFYTVTLRNVVNIPLLDDYDSLLDFLNHFVSLNGASARASYFLAAQHNEYKLFFGNGVACLQLALFGQIDFRELSIIGDGFIFLLAILLWKMFIPHTKDLAARLTFFIPVSWLLFQFQYWETLNWAMAGLQNIPILVFSLASIYFLVKGTRASFCGALLLFTLAVSASGNGFFLFPIGLLILLLNRSYLRVFVWLLVAVGCIAAYAYHYNLMVSQTHAHHSVLSSFHPLSPLYMLAFIGGAAGIPVPALSILLGALLVGLFIFMIRRGYIRSNPLVSCCILFLLLTTVGVAGLRSDFGLGQALSSRYTIYSALFLIFAWFAIVEMFLQNSKVPLLRSSFFLGAVALTILFSVCMDLLGTLGLDARHDTTMRAMATFEHPKTPDTTIWPAPMLPLPHPIGPTNEFNQRIRPILDESIKLGVYRPPPL